MTENKRFISSGRWIQDNYVGALLNIEFNTDTDRDMCCRLLNQLEDKKSEYVKIVDKYFEENKQLKEELDSFEQVSFTDLCDGSRTVLYMKKENVGDGNE